jgi:xanthine dehydrogenase accessory factor
MDTAEELVLLNPRLCIFGGGDVSVALAPVAAQAGFSIVVIDDRPDHATAQRFPMAAVLYTSYPEAFERIQPDSNTYLLLATRGHESDLRILEWALRTEARGFSPRYIGMMGKPRKVISVYQTLEQQGIPRAQLERVHAPVGLDLGALTPAEIAISIAAELIAVRRNSPHQKNKSIKLSEIPPPPGDPL